VFVYITGYCPWTRSIVRVWFKCISEPEPWCGCECRQLLKVDPCC